MIQGQPVRVGKIYGPGVDSSAALGEGDGEVVSIPPSAGVRVSVGEAVGVAGGVGDVGLGVGEVGLGVGDVGLGVGDVGLGVGVGVGVLSSRNLTIDLSGHLLPKPPRFSLIVTVFSETCAVLTDIAEVPWP
ncbi:MAG TPA: hypothetical protein VJM12_04175 [Pyrinomonadaceae bacterium]|nr:hypothetical protein [Pyrinomonadaceae bacterium]